MNTMMNVNRIVIDRELCTGCGACVSVCPAKIISIAEGKSGVSLEEGCIGCGHCAAICPQAAIRVPSIDEQMSHFNTFAAINKWLPPGEYSTAALVQLMASRRSCRNFLERPVDRAALEDLIKIGITAPSGTNSQAWTFTVLPTRKAVISFAGNVALYYEKLNAQAENAALRLFLRLIGQGELDAYYRGYYRKVKEALKAWRESGRDPLFHGSTAAVIIGARPGASCPAEDALLAAQNILLVAHSMGLGSCLIGFAVEAIRRDPSIKLSAGIPSEEEIYAVIALGYPDEIYQHTAGRRKVTPRYFEG